MACTSCRQSRCVCTDAAVFGIPVTVEDPQGDLIADTIPCESSCSSTPTDPSQCDNYFYGREGGDGASFLYSSSGPFSLAAPASCGTYACPPTPNLVALPDALTGFVDPGVLQGVVCMTLPPGTYTFEAVMTILNAIPGTRVVVLYRPNCDDASIEFAILDISAPCAPVSAGVFVGALQPVSLQGDGTLTVPNNGCQAGFRILAQTGCAQCAGEIGATSPSITNFQLIGTRLSSRDLININTGDTGNSGSNGLNQFEFNANPSRRCTSLT